MHSTIGNSGESYIYLLGEDIFRTMYMWKDIIKLDLEK